MAEACPREPAAQARERQPKAGQPRHSADLSLELTLAGQQPMQSLLRGAPLKKGNPANFAAASPPCGSNPGGPRRGFRSTGNLGVRREPGRMTG